MEPWSIPFIMYITLLRFVDLLEFPLILDFPINLISSPHKTMNTKFLQQFASEMHSKFPLLSFLLPQLFWGLMHPSSSTFTAWEGPLFSLLYSNSLAWFTVMSMWVNIFMLNFKHCVKICCLLKLFQNFFSISSQNLSIVFKLSQKNQRKEYSATHFTVVFL